MNAEKNQYNLITTVISLKIKVIVNRLLTL